MLFEAQSLLYFIETGDFADFHFNVKYGHEMYRGSKLREIAYSAGDNFDMRI